MGLPVLEARAIRLGTATSIAARASAPPRNDPNGSNGSSGQQTIIREGGSIPNVTPAMMYNPTVHRATTLYEEMMQRDFREEFKGGMSTMQKVQIGSFLIMAIASVGLLVFLILITQE